MKEQERRFFPSDRAEECAGRHLLVSREGARTLIIETPFGEFKITPRQTDAHEGRSMWALYDCAVCGSIQAIQL